MENCLEVACVHELHDQVGSNAYAQQAVGRLPDTVTVAPYGSGIEQSWQRSLPTAALRCVRTVQGAANALLEFLADMERGEGPSAAQNPPSTQMKRVSKRLSPPEKVVGDPAPSEKCCVIRPLSCRPAPQHARLRSCVVAGDGVVARGGVDVA